MAPSPPQDELAGRALSGASRPVSSGGGGGEDHSTLLRRTLSGLRVTGFLTALKTLLDLGGQLALARLLAPSAFGVFGFAQSLSGLVSCFTDLAGQKYLIQKKGGLDRETLDSVFTLELLLGGLVAGLWAAVSGPALEALGRPEQAPFARWLAIWIVLERLMLPRALLDRAMAFGRSNLALTIGTIASVAVMIAAALAGAGPWTFIAGLITRTAVSAAAMWLWAPLRPRLRRRAAAARARAAVGAPILLTSALTFYYTNVDYLIVQAALGYTALGLYYAAYRYPHYIHQFQYLVSTVVYPAFSKAKDLGQLARGFSMVTKYTAALGAAPALVVWILGESAVRALLSDTWTPATFCFQVFTLLAVLRMTCVHWYDAYVSQGRTRVIPWISAGNALLTTAGAAAGVAWAGIEGAAVLVTLATALTLAFCCGVLVKRLLAVRYLEILRAPLLAAAVAGWAGFFLAREPWLPGADGAGAAAARVWADFLLRAGAVLGLYGAVFLALDWREILSILRRQHRGAPPASSP